MFVVDVVEKIGKIALMLLCQQRISDDPAMCQNPSA